MGHVAPHRSFVLLVSWLYKMQPASSRDTPPLSLNSLLLATLESCSSVAPLPPRKRAYAFRHGRTGQAQHNASRPSPSPQRPSSSTVRPHGPGSVAGRCPHAPNVQARQPPVASRRRRTCELGPHHPRTSPSMPARPQPRWGPAILPPSSVAPSRWLPSADGLSPGSSRT